MAGTGPGDLNLLCSAFLAACEDALDTIPAAEPELSGTPSRAYVSPGIPALDCCDQLTVDARSVVEDARSPSGPGSGQRARYGARKNQVALVATITRCIPVINDTKNPPAPAEMESAAAQINADGWALWNVLWNLVRSGNLFTLCGDSSPTLRQLAPSGGCAGWTLQMVVELEGYES